MPLYAGILVVFLASAQAQPPRSPVLEAISASSASGSLPELIKALDADGKAAALAGLDRLDRAALDSAALAELSEAYRLLGRPENALKAARALSSRDGGAAAGDAQEIMSLAQAGDYAAAQAAAEEGLKRSPGDKNLLALFHQVKGRGVGGASLQRIVSPREPPLPAQETRPYVLRIKTEKGAPPPPPARDAGYLAPGARKPSDYELLEGAVIDMVRYKFDIEWPAEKKRMAELRSKLDETETGRALVADLGGWTRIQRDADVRFAAVWRDGLNAYYRPFDTPDSKGRRGALVLRKELLNEPDAVAVPILAHELSHLRDFRGEHGLAIPSEFAAHRTQIQVYEEMRRDLTPAETKRLAAGGRGQYQAFIALLWEDRLLQRFKTPEAMAAATGSETHFVKLARDVFRDLQSGSVAPGGAQIDHHLNGLNDGVYRQLTSEKDIVDLIREREASGAYDSAQRLEDKRILAQRAELLALSEKRDSEFRSKHGFKIEENK